MAFASTHDHAIAESRPGALSRFLSAFYAATMRLAEARSRSDRVMALEQLSDEQLAARGLTRDGIVAYVFRDVGYC